MKRTALARKPWVRRRRSGPVQGRPALGREEYALTVHRQVLERDGWACANPMCRCPRDVQVDHCRPRSQGAPDDPAILVTLCRTCNTLKEQGILIVMPNGDGTFRFQDLRQRIRCEDCSRTLATGDVAVVPTRNGGSRMVTAP